MFCPRCATQNLDDAKFCRACGADVHLVPQALAGLPPTQAAKQEGGGAAGRRQKDEKDPKLLEKGMKNVFVGVAFLVIFLAGLLWFRGAFMMWIWFIIPALADIGEGLGQLLRSRREHQLLMAGVRPAAFYDAGGGRPLPRAGFDELPAPDTADMAGSPFSVTEATTMHLAGRADDATKKV
jgi:hypothetical protein